VAAIFLA